MVSVDLLAARQGQAAHATGFVRPGLDLDIGHPLLEAYLAAQRLDLRAHLLDHADQPKGADVRLGDIQDLFGRRP